MRKRDRFMELLEQSCESLLKELAHMTYNEEDARDLFQDTVLLAYEHFSELRNEASFSSWIRACARSAVSAKYRKKMNREIPVDTASSKVSEIKILTFTDEESQDVLDAVLQKMEIEELSRIISELGFKERVFLHMRYEMELSMKEIAEQLGTTPEYLAVLNHRIKEKLRKRKQALDG